MPLWETVVDLTAQADVVRRRRYGVIELRDGRLASIHFRPLPNGRRCRTRCSSARRTRGGRPIAAGVFQSAAAVSKFSLRAVHAVAAAELG